jgi:hypothetical protein
MPFDDKANWVQPPQIRKGMIAAINGPKEVAGGKTWLGTPGDDFGIATLPTQQQPPPTEEHFLEFVGWEPVATPPVTPTSNNRHAALQPNEYTVALQDSYAWYYVQYLDNTDLQNYTANPNIDSNGLNLFKAVATNSVLNTPRLLLYHLLYPLHQETLEGCENAGEGRLFGTYAGEWACIALLLDKAGAPLFIGLTSRNTASPAFVGAEDRRVGMTVSDWKDVQSVKDGTNMRPKIFVSLDTHGNYRNYLVGGSQPQTPFTPGGVDPSSQSCGQVEGLDDAIAGDITIPGTPATPATSATVGGALILLTKTIISGSIGEVLGAVGGGVGVIAGLIEGLSVGVNWAGAESCLGSFGTPGTPDTLASPAAQPTDITGGPMFGRIIRPKNLAFTEVNHASSLTDWNVKPFTAPDGRSYAFVVDRSSQVWWAPRPAPRGGTMDLPNANGFTGRWGPRVTNDPNSRRAGMKCPDFAIMFLEALAVKLTKDP